MKRLGWDIICLGIFSLIVLVFFYQTILFGKLPVPTDTLVGLYHPWRDAYATTHPRGVPFKNFLITDPIRQQIPWRKLVIDSFAEGRLPSWNPFNFAGSSLAANIQAAPWYFFNILFWLLPFPWAWTVLIMLAPLLGGIFFYCYARSVGLSRFSSLFGALSWAFCGFSVAWMTWGTITHVSLWLPLILLVLDKMRASAKGKAILGWSVLLGFVLATVVFAGHIQVAFYVFVMALFYGIIFSWKQKTIQLKWVFVTLGIFIPLAAWQGIPLMQSVGASARASDASVWLSPGWFLPGIHLLQFLAPDFFGNPATLNYWGTWNYGELVGYIGALPLVFAFYGALSVRSRLSTFFSVASVGVLLFLLPTPIAKIPYVLHLPILSTIQPTRLMVLLDFSLIMLAAIGFDSFVKSQNKRIFWVWLGILSVILVSYFVVINALPLGISGDMAVAQRNLMLPTALFVLGGAGIALLMILKGRLKWIVTCCLIGVTVFDLLRFAWKFTPFTQGEYFFPKTKVLSFLQGKPRPFRVMSLDNRILPPNTSAYYGIESIEGYDPIYDARYEEYMAALNRKAPNTDPPFGFNRIITATNVDSPLLPLLNVRYVLTLGDFHHQNLQKVFEEGETKIYEYTKQLPRIFPVESVKSASSLGEVMQTMYDPDFHPLSLAVVLTSSQFEEAKISAHDTIRITRDEGSGVLATSEFTAPHFVVILNRFDPGWNAYIDGKRVDIYRTNYLFQGLYVPKGSHTLKLIYQNL